MLSSTVTGGWNAVFSDDSGLQLPFPDMSILEVSSMDKVLALKARIPPSPSLCPSQVRTHLFRKDTLPKYGNSCAIKQVFWSLTRDILIGLVNLTWQTDALVRIQNKK